MKAFVTLIFLLIAKAAFCCFCVPKMPFKEEQDLKDYQFIALVKIKKLAPLDTLNRFWQLRTTGDIGIEVAELFKGEAIDKVYDGSFKSDCALRLKEGEEWLFFGSISNGRMSVGLCSYNVRYRDSLGVREFEYNTGMKQLDMLRRIYNRPLNSNVTKIQLYANGKTEIDQNFKNGTLHGTRKIYYPDGKLYVKEKFNHGVRVGVRRSYLPSGQLSMYTRFRSGLIKKAVLYTDTTDYNGYLLLMAKNPHDLLFGDKNPLHDSLYYIRLRDSLMRRPDWGKRIANYYEYENDGRSYIMKAFGYLGNLQREGYLDWKRQVSESRAYYDNGKLKTYTKYDQANDRYIEHNYDEKGIKREFDRKCEYCKYHFDPKADPQAKPLTAYVQ